MGTTFCGQQRIQLRPPAPVFGEANRILESGDRTLWLELRRVVEELLLCNLLALPALIREFLHLGRRSVQPAKAKDPANHRDRAIDEDRPNAHRLDRPGSPENALLVLDQAGPADSGCTLVLANGAVLDIELGDSLGVCAGFDASDEAFERVCGWHFWVTGSGRESRVIHSRSSRRMK